MSHIAIVLAAVLAFVFNFLALQQRDSTTLVAIAAGPIPEGAPLTRDLVRFVPLASDFEGLQHLVVESDLDELEGWIVGRSVAQGEVIDRSAIIQPGAGDGLRTMSIPVPIEHAAGGTLVAGDRVDVIDMVGDEPAFVAVDLEVVSIGETSQGALAGVGTYHVVVGVTPDDALALASAVSDGELELVRSTGAGEIPERDGDGS